jgi:hypothetical protein
MKILKCFIPEIGFFIAAIMLISCNLEDFNMKKLADPTDIVPDVSAPLVYGTFKVANLIPLPAPVNSTPIPSNGLELPIVVSKLGTSFSSAAIDSVYLNAHFTNETPSDMEFELSFLNSATGLPNGKVFNSGKIPPNVVDFAVIPFGLDRKDQDNLQNATFVKLNFKLYPSATISTYGEVKSKQFTVKISFNAPVKLQKL